MTETIVEPGTTEEETTESGGTETGGTEGTGTEGTGTQSGTGTGTSIINRAVESVVEIINAMNLFASMTRGALGTGAGLTCEIGPTSPEAVFMDKNQYIPIDLTLNGKHSNLQTLTDAMNGIHEALTMRKTYPYGTDWKIVDITTETEPQILEREENNMWVMASSLLVKTETKKG